MNFFGQGWITAFGIIKFVPDYINIAASMSNIASDSSILVLEAIEKIKSKVPAKYHGYINVFIDREATTVRNGSTTPIPMGSISIVFIMSDHVVISRKASYYLVCPTEWTVRSGRGE